MNKKRAFRFTKPMVFLTYLLVWGLAVGVFWLYDNDDAIGYTLVYFYFALPLTTLLLSLHIGINPSWGKFKWLMILFFGVMYMMAAYVTYSLGNMVACQKMGMPKVNYPELKDIWPGVIVSAVGMVFGRLIQFLKAQKETN